MIFLEIFGTRVTLLCEFHKLVRGIIFWFWRESRQLNVVRKFAIPELHIFQDSRRHAHPCISCSLVESQSNPLLSINYFYILVSIKIN